MPYMLSCDSTTDLTLAQYAALDLHYVSLHFLLTGRNILTTMARVCR